MKKILSALILIGFLTVLVIPQVAPEMPQVAFAQEQEEEEEKVEGVLEGCTLEVEAAQLSGCPVSPAKCNFETHPRCGVCCFLQTLYKVTDWMFVILIAVSALYVIIGAMNLLMSAGDPGKVTSGRNYVMYAVIGLIVGGLAKAIPAIVKLAVGA